MKGTILSLLLCASISSVMLAGCAGSGGGSIFDDTSTANSAHGTVGRDVRAYSPNGRYYCQQVEPYLHGAIGIYDRQTSSLVRTITTLPPTCTNDLKGMCWSRDSRYIAVMYHSGEAQGIRLYDIADGTLFRNVGEGVLQSGDYWIFMHYMVFSADNTRILCSCCGHTIDVEYLSGLDAR